MNEWSLLKALWSTIDKRKQRHFVLLLVIMLAAAFAEMISIGAVVPFLAVMAMSEDFSDHGFLVYAVNLFGVGILENLEILVTVIFCGTVFLAGVIRLVWIFALNRWSFVVGADLSAEAYRRVLFQDYVYFKQEGSSEAINSITLKSNIVINSILRPFLVMMGSSIVLVSAVAVALFIDFFVTSLVFLVFGGVYFLAVLMVRQKLTKNSSIIAFYSTKIVKLLRESLGGIRDIKIGQNEKFFISKYREIDSEVRRSTAATIFIASSPRYFIETFAIITMAVAALVFTTNGSSMTNAIPTLGALALAAQRGLPLLQQVYSSYSEIRGAKESLRDFLNLLRLPLSSETNFETQKIIPFNDYIELKDVSFKYEGEREWIFEQLNLQIFKGECIGIVGPTGCGKSTLVDIILGLVEPNSGYLSVDNRILCSNERKRWLDNVAIVPQDVYLFDDTVEANIAVGVKEANIDKNKILHAAEGAQIAQVVNSWPDAFLTVVGERGVKISGGQKQRIGLARAYYRDAEVLVLDEATSALDGATESRIIEILEKNKGSKTIIIIAHRLTTIKFCDRILSITPDKNVKVVNFDEI